MTFHLESTVFTTLLLFNSGFLSPLKKNWTSLVAQTVKRLLQCGRPGFHPWVGKIRWRRKWQSTPVLLPGKPYGQGSLVGYSPWGRKESDTTERPHFHFQDNGATEVAKI